MSASREKKQRQQVEGLTEKQRQQAREAQKSKTRKAVHIILAVIVVLLIVALLVWNSGFFQKRATAVTVGDEAFAVSELSYYYYLTANNTASTARNYAQYGIDIGYDPDVSPATQMYSEELTYADYFRQTAVESLQQVTLLCAEAEKAGYTLSAEGKATVDDVLSQIEQNSITSGYSKSAYLKLLYGSYITESAFLKHISMSTLADEYQTHYTDSLSYTDADLVSYYNENSTTLDTYDYRYCFISGVAASATDASGNAVEPTEDEEAAAMALAKSKADEMIARYQAGEEFNALAVEYVSEASAASYSDPGYNHLTDKLGSDIAEYTYGEWLLEDGRKTGDITAVEASESGYYVVTLLGRARAENTYQSVDVRHILVLAETDEAADDADVVPTEEQLADARSEAQRLLDEWKSGAATSESFAALADLNSDDTGSNTNGGLYEAVERNTMIDSFNNWIFTPGRKAGDSGIVENTNGSTDDVLGYHVMYLEALGQVRWKYQAQSQLSSEDYNAWYESVEGNYPVTTNAGGLALVK